MLRIFKTDSGHTHEINKIVPGSWVLLVDPEPAELVRVREARRLELDDIRDTLDPDEKSRVDVDEDYTMIIVDVPVDYIENGRRSFKTIPLSIIDDGEVVITICLEHLDVDSFMTPRKGALVLDTQNRSLLVMQLFAFFANRYQRFLRDIDKQRQVIEDRGMSNPNDVHFVDLYELRKALVYFRISLTSNKVVYDKIFDPRRIEDEEDLQEVFEDVIVETAQAIEMTNIYAEILKTTISQMQAVMDHSLNRTMKILAVVAAVMTIPTVVSGFFGMNVFEKSIPFWNDPHGFAIIVGATMVSCILMTGLFMIKRIR